MKFTELNLSQEILDGIEVMGFEETTDVQSRAIPEILSGKDIIASAQTGTGKTAAFLLPIIERLSKQKDKEGIKALVIVPTRELAVQIQQNLEGMAYYTDISSIAIYGGRGGTSYSSEKMALEAGVDIVIGTPGRIISHSNMPYADWSNLGFLVLDEADRMLDMGFFDDLMRIVSKLPKTRQNLLFSATMPVKMRQLARKLLKEPAEINISISKPAERVKQEAYILHENQKLPLLQRILDERKMSSVLVFCSTKIKVKTLYKSLKVKGASIGEIHSDLDQDKREEILNQYKNKNLNILIATDILSRGIDVEDIEMVINFDVPPDAEDYIHRIGRTARAASEGSALTFVNVQDQRNLYAIEELIEDEVPKIALPKELGETPEYQPQKHNNRRPYFKGKGGSSKKRNFRPKSKNRKPTNGTGKAQNSGNTKSSVKPKTHGKSNHSGKGKAQHKARPPKKD